MSDENNTSDLKEPTVFATNVQPIEEPDVEAGRRKGLGKKFSSVLDTHDDPFASREGKTLDWKNVNMTLVCSSVLYYRWKVWNHGITQNTWSFLLLQAGKKGEESRKLLDNVWGEVPARETTAIMGPSGAGKTSLLNILAGRAASRGNVTIEADVRLNNYSVDPTNIQVRKQIAFVAQDDSLQVTATPREAIRFSAKLRLPRSTTEHQLDSLTTRMLTELGKGFKFVWIICWSWVNLWDSQEYWCVYVFCFLRISLDAFISR